MRAPRCDHEKLKTDANFMNALQVLLVGYLLSGKCTEELNKSTGNSIKKNLQKTNFYSNGEKLSNKYNGPHHPLTLKFQNCLCNGENLQLKEPSSATLSHDKSSRISELLKNKGDSSDTESERISVPNNRNTMSPVIARRKSRDYMIRSPVNPSLFKKVSLLCIKLISPQIYFIRRAKILETLMMQTQKTLHLRGVQK